MSDEIRREDVVQNTLSEAWDLFSNDFVLYVLASLLMVVVSLVTLGVLSGPMTVGFIKLIERRRRGDDATVTDIFDGFSHFGASLIASILIGIGIFIGVLLFVLPGLLFGLATAFSFHAIAIDDEDATGAISKSISTIKENLAVAAIFLIIVLVISGIGTATFLGTLLTMPFSLVLMTLAYHELRTA